jgi:small subunit ribosomal protein S11
MFQQVKNLLKPASKPMFVLHANCTRNNTILNLSSTKTLKVVSCGMVGFKKARRGTTDAAYKATTKILEDTKIDLLHLKLKGFGPGREQVFRAVRSLHIAIGRITDVTPIAHGGCRPRKARRI